ncbi:hypothetical protein IFM89_031456 [Coptis chinensis]|uniref:Major facilitator superfamily (MFS) profile domain-containing protein n=1 Tax=Coptis chinensis TaxID=261450 RepID=A0A835HIK4_9MAGN|nr:hypothetical protein IFM89_031456 [Coptis chinensis]
MRCVGLSMGVIKVKVNLPIYILAAHFDAVARCQGAGIQELSFGTSLGVYPTLIFLILLGRAVLVILGSAISSVFNKMYGFPMITYNDQAGLMRGVVSIALAFSQASSFGMTTSHLLVAVAFYWKAVVEEGSRSYGVMGILSLVGLVSFVVFFSLGIGAIPWVIMSEILPINIKGLAGSIATPPTAQILVDNYDIKLASTSESGGTFIIYTVVSAFTVVFVALWVPETKGRTLEEIQWSFR